MHVTAEEMEPDLWAIGALDGAGREAAPDPLRCSPRAIAEAALQMVERQASDRGLGIFMHYADDVPDWIFADELDIAQILLGFLSNAVKFTTSGSITLGVALDPTDPAALRFDVVDTGVGIEAGRQLSLFRRFVRPGSPEREDASPSLVTCKQLADALPHGRIGVLSNPGRGSLFWFSAHFPISSDEPLPAPPAERDAINGETLRISVAGDGLLNQEHIQRFLIGAGHRVTTVANGRQVVDAVRRVRFDLILTELSMPEMDAVEAARQIRAMPGPASTIPIIAVAGDVRLDEVDRYRAQGISALLARPLGRAGLLHKVVNLVQAAESRYG